MANRKTLKKEINNICGSLLGDCMALGLCEGADKDKLCQVMARIMTLCSDSISRISHTEPGKARDFYKKLREDFSKEVQAISEEIQKA